MGALLCSLQGIDWFLTSVGVSRYGISIEGNPLIRALMHEYGSTLALGLVKSLAILVVFVLTYYGRKVPWVNNAMGAVACVYLFAAIIPWTYILFFNS